MKTVSYVIDFWGNIITDPSELTGFDDRFIIRYLDCSEFVVHCSDFGVFSYGVSCAFCKESLQNSNTYKPHVAVPIRWHPGWADADDTLIHRESCVPCFVTRVPILFADSTAHEIARFMRQVEAIAYES